MTHTNAISLTRGFASRLRSCRGIIATDTSFTQAVLLDNNSMTVWPNMSVFVGNTSTALQAIYFDMFHAYFGPSFISIQNNSLTALPTHALAGWHGEFLALYLQNNNITRIESQALVEAPIMMCVATLDALPCITRAVDVS